MADYPISDVPRRIVYTGSAGVGPYAYDFEILTNTDINVYKNDALLTLTTDYTVSISPTLGTGSVTLVSAAISADRITIVGSRAIQRTSDFTTGGDFFANTLNNEMDSQTILTQQVAETAERSIKAPVTDPTNIDMTLPINTARAGKTLAFDANGNPVAGDPIGNWRDNWASGTSYQNRDLIKDTTNSNVYLCTVSHTSSGSLPISTNADSAKWALVVDAVAADASATAAAASASAASGSASAASTSASNASTSASNASTSASTATTQASNASASATSAAASYDSFDDRYLGAKASNPTLDNDGNALLTGALYFNSTTSVMNVYTGSAWVAAYVSGTGFLTVASNLSDVANTTTARTNISAAKSGANSDITSITGLTTPLSVAQGGTGTSIAQVISSKIQSVTASVASSALTATLNPTALDFRSTPLTSGTVNTRSIASAISVIVPLTATLGTINAIQSRLVLLAIDNAGTVELAIVNIAGGNNLDETTLINTTALSTGSDSNNIIYSTTARTGVPFRVVGYIESTQATAGTWATAPSTIQGYGGQALAAMSSLGYGQTWQVVTRVNGTTYYNTTGKPIVLVFRGSDATGQPLLMSGMVNGVNLVNLSGTSAAATNSVEMLIPVGASYSVTWNASATFVGTTELR